MNDNIMTLEQLKDISNKGKINKSDLEKIVSLSNDINSEVRTFVAELLVMSHSELSKETLIKLVSDSDYLVRANACDSLCIFHDDDVLELLLNVLQKDPDEIVRAYAVLSACDILAENDMKEQKDKVSFIHGLLRSEDSKQVKIAIYKTLYQLGEQSYFNHILFYVNDNEYTIRCFTLNMLQDIVNTSNKTIIFDAINELKKHEKSEAVQSIIYQMMKLFN